jgi:hypothetical protein
MHRPLALIDLERPSHQRVAVALFVLVLFPLSLVLGVSVFFALL